MQTKLTLIGIGMLVLSACSGAADNPSADAPPETTFGAIVSELTTVGRPSVVNSWAAWCPPCRSEAPLLSAAASANTDVHFIMLNTKDNPNNAAAFISESFSSAPMTHYADPNGAITAELGGGRGLPVTLFYNAEGEVVYTHRGILDEPTLALYLDEIRQ